MPIEMPYRYGEEEEDPFERMIGSRDTEPLDDTTSAPQQDMPSEPAPYRPPPSEGYVPQPTFTQMQELGLPRPPMPEPTVEYGPGPQILSKTPDQFADQFALPSVPDVISEAPATLQPTPSATDFIASQLVPGGGMITEYAENMAPPTAPVEYGPGPQTITENADQFTAPDGRPELSHDSTTLQPPALDVPQVDDGPRPYEPPYEAPAESYQPPAAPAEIPSQPPTEPTAGPELVPASPDDIITETVDHMTPGAGPETAPAAPAPPPAAPGTPPALPNVPPPAPFSPTNPFGSVDILSLLLGGVTGHGAGSELADATSEAAMHQLHNPSPYNSDEVKAQYDWLAGDIDDDFSQRELGLDESMARRGLFGSVGKDFHSGRMSDLNVGRRSAKQGLARDLAHEYARTAGDYQANAINQGQSVSGQAHNTSMDYLRSLFGFGQQGFENDMDVARFNADQNSEYQRLLELMLNAGYGG